MRNIVFILSLFGVYAEAEVSVLFHPYDATFEAIAQRLGNAKKTIDIAMYNMDSDEENPIIGKLKSPEVQALIRSKGLKVRLIFEGSPGSSKQAEKLRTFKQLGMEVRFLTSGRKMHHKFAVIDIETDKPVLISGSANWSLFSRKNYNENILFFDDEDEISKAFQRQFEFLWALSKKGSEDQFDILKVPMQGSELQPPSSGPKAFFNTENFKVKNGRLVEDSSKKGFYLTRKVVEQIDQAQRTIRIATTRIKLRPIYEALLRAAARGVKTDIVVTMNEYESWAFRHKRKVPVCEDVFDKDCSSGDNFTVFLQREDFPGHENISLRVKFFDIDQRNHLSKQMHSKYIVVDDQYLLTGSFNWSYSAEYGHIENLVFIDGRKHPEVIEEFITDFNYVFGMNRESYDKVISYFEEALKKRKKIECSFEPLSLSFEEIDYLMGTDRRMGKSFHKACF